MTTYYVDSNATGANTGASWTDAATSLSVIAASLTSADTVYLEYRHINASYGSSTTFTFPSTPGLQLLSVDKDASNALRAGATERSGAFNLILDGTVYCWGVYWYSGVGGSGSHVLSVMAGTTNKSPSVFENCKLYLQSTGASASMYVGTTTNFSSGLSFINSMFGFSATGQKIILKGNNDFSGCSLDAGKSAPTALIKASTSNGVGSCRFSSCDFSFASALFDVTEDSALFLEFVGCLLPSTRVSGTHTGVGGCRMTTYSCSTSADDHSYQFSYVAGEGNIDHNTSIYLTTGGASFTDTGGTSAPLSLAVVSSANASKPFPLKTPWFNTFIGATGSKTLSVKIAYDNATALKDIDCWIEVEYMGNTANPGSTNTISAPVVSGTNSLDVLAAGSNLTDTSAGWTGTGGWSNKKTATLSKTVTVNQQGFARARVCLANASTTIYVDPQLTVA